MCIIFSQKVEVVEPNLQESCYVYLESVDTVLTTVQVYLKIAIKAVEVNLPQHKS